MSRKSNELSCAQCGYDQRGNPDSTVCPECGFVCEGESFEFGYMRSRWFLLLTAAGWLGVLVLQLTHANPWLVNAALCLLIGISVWDTIAKRRLAKAQILVNTTGFRVVNADSPHGRWVTWDKVFGVSKSRVANMIFIAAKDPDPHQIEIGPTKNSKQLDEVHAAIAACYPTKITAETEPAS